MADIENIQKRPQLYMDGTKLNRHLAEVVSWQKDEWFAPIHMEISPSKVCNQHCSFCYIEWSQGNINMPRTMLMDLIRDGARIGIKSALLAGEGEPTLNPAYVDAIELAGEVGLDMALNTNAVTMTEEDMRRFLPHLSWMRCSVQAAHAPLYSEIHESPERHFEMAINNIALASQIKREMGLEVAIGVQQVLLNENGPEIPELARLAKSIGADYYVIKPCHIHDYNTYEKQENLVEKFRPELEAAEALSDGNFKAVVRWNFLNEAEQPRTYARCLGISFIIQITADGRVVTCYPWADKKEHEYGTLAGSDIEAILKSPDFKKTCKWVEDEVDVSACMPTCRQHNANKYLWWLSEETPDHLNFI